MDDVEAAWQSGQEDGREDDDRMEEERKRFADIWYDLDATPSEKSRALKRYSAYKDGRVGK